MKKFWIFCALVFAGFTGYGQTISQGGLAFVHFNSVGNPVTSNEIAFVCREFIPKGEVFFITNRNKSSSGVGFDSTLADHGTMVVELEEDLSIGQSIAINFTAGASPSPNANFCNVQMTSLSAGFDLGGGSDPDEIWVYQGTKNSPTNWITGVFWNKGSKDYTPTGLSSVYIFDLSINGASGKCGTWKPFLGTYIGPSSLIPNLDFNATITSVLYNVDYWEISNSNGASNSVNPCDPELGTIKGFETISGLIIFKNIYRYGYTTASQWEYSSDGGANWQANQSPPNYTSATSKAIVQIYQNIEIGNAFNSSSPGTQEFIFGELLVSDQKNDGATLTIPAGGTLKIGNKLTWEETTPSGNKKPTIVFNSAEAQSGEKYYALLGATNANLDEGVGQFQYNYLVTMPGWHHLASPIVTSFGKLNKSKGNCLITPQSGSNQTFAFRTSSRNFYAWDPSNAQWTAPDTSELFSAGPYTIYFESDEVPVMLKVSGALKVEDQNIQSNQSASYGTPPGSGSNVPGWVSTSYTSGWNFYSNPFISYLSYDDMVDNFDQNVGKSNSNKMTNVNGSINVWQPDASSSNVTGNYMVRSAKTSPTGAFSGSNAPQFLPPFQAFFLKNNFTGNNTTSFVISKKYRSSSFPGASNTIKNKLSVGKLGLWWTNFDQKVETYLGEDENSKAIQGLQHVDVPFFGEVTNALGFMFENTAYAIKYVPVIEDQLEMDVLAVSAVQGQLLSINNFGSNYHEYLFDRKTNAWHDFDNGPYHYSNDTTYQGPRFKYVVMNRGVGMEENTNLELSHIAYLQENALVVESPWDENVTLYAINGTKILSMSIHQGLNILPWDMSLRGVFVLVGERSQSSTKLIVP